MEQRGRPRVPDSAIAFMQPLHTSSSTTFRVELIDLSPTGAGLRTMIPASCGAPVVLSIAQHPPQEGLFLCRVAHCTKLANGRYHIGMTIHDQRPGNLNTTRIPDTWRK